MFASEEEEGLVLFGVGRLELIAQAEPPLILQLQTHHRLTQGAAVGADHTQSGPWERRRREEKKKKG